jgi:hypothetical protein
MTNVARAMTKYSLSGKYLVAHRLLNLFLGNSVNHANQRS